MSSSEKPKILVIGGGCWGTVIANIIAENVKLMNYVCDRVELWLYDENVNFNGVSKSLITVINEEHENIKYLPNHKLSNNLIAVFDLIDSAKHADYLVFVVPHQFISSVCTQIKDHISCSAQALVLTKGLSSIDGVPVVYSDIIEKHLNIPCCAISGANIATCVAKKEFSETTLGFQSNQLESISFWKSLFDTPYFKVNCIADVVGVQLCGALKNIVALGVGFCEALGLSSNTKAAVMRIGIQDIKLFACLFFDTILEETFDDSAGFADLITTCWEGRNVRCAAAFVHSNGKLSWEEIENKMLNGQKLQGPQTLKVVNCILQQHKIEKYFPLFEAINNIAFANKPANTLIDALASNCYHTFKEKTNRLTGVYHDPRLHEIKSMNKS